ncbi:MAG TPA: hypothetical protein VKB94_08965 [Rhizomicrobium sp.]|nr:hypothetical protein [Rhizomicrobium sp.]
MKKLFVKTYGCQMNAYDSAKMADLLAPLGYATTDVPEGADMVILNTCHIREKAAEKVYSELGRLKALKADNEIGSQRNVGPLVSDARDQAAVIIGGVLAIHRVQHRIRSRLHR